MLDRRFVLDNLELIDRMITERRSRPVDLSALVTLESQRRDAERRLQELRTAAKSLAKDRAVDAAEHGRRLRDEERTLRAEATRLREGADELLAAIPNLIHPSSPRGGEEDSETIAHSAAAPKTFAFEVKDHVDLATDMGILDLAAGSRVAGAGFYFLQGEAVLLEFALQRFALDRVISAGFFPQIVPELVSDAIAAGVGYAPRGDESNSYHIEDGDLNLIATSEVVLCGRYAGQVIRFDDLPIKVCGVSHCFRTERAYGRATRGLYRVHQFSKVEMVIVCLPEQSETMHQRMLEIERSIFDELELPYRVLEIASGDLGAPAYRKFDIEAWMPGRGADGQYSEVTSASNCLDYQSRRLDIKYHDPKDNKRKFAHTLNGTGIAVGRAMIAILENNQRADGTVDVPLALRPYLGGLDRITGQTIR